LAFVITGGKLVKHNYGAANACAHHTLPSFKTRLLQVAGVSLLTLCLAVPAAAASKPIPALVNAFNMSYGGPQGGKGEITALAIDPTTGNIYTAEFQAGHVSLISQSIAKTKSDIDVNINPDIATIYAASPPTFPEAIVTVNTINPTGGIYAQEMVLDPKTGNIYISNDSPYNTVTVLNTNVSDVIATIPMPNDPHGLAVDPDAGKVYVTNYLGSSISVIDEKSNTIVSTIAVPALPQHLAIDLKRKKLYVVQITGSVTVIDLKTQNIINTIKVGSLSWGTALDSKTGKLYVSNYLGESISVIDVNTDTVITTIADPGQHPIYAVADTAHGTIYVAHLAQDPNYGDGTTAAIIDEKTDTITGLLTVFAYPRSIGIDEARGLLYFGTGVPNDSGMVAAYQIPQ
jgi:YVTN family beta-propeller protein